MIMSSWIGIKRKIKDRIRPSPLYPVVVRTRKRLDRLRLGGSQPYDFIANDITNICNLRCPFCFNDWNAFRSPVYMSEDVLRKVVELIPLVKGPKFFFSCSFEPTLHPRFIDYLEMIPNRYRAKVFFSTNLNTKISDDVFRRLSAISLHHINVSIESFRREQYEMFRKNGNFERFIDNLDHMTAAFSASRTAPKVHFITIVNKLNCGEIPALVARCGEQYGAAEHSLRLALINVSANSDWVNRYSLSAEETDILKKELARAKRRHSLYLPRDAEADAPSSVPSRSIRIRADGTAVVHGTQYSLSEIEDVRSFFTQVSRSR
jgi:MoaA/NifB/PqqE/SkfB family radical SAM enzyme